MRVALATPKATPWSLGPADDTPLAEGATVLAVLAASFERYWGQAAATFSVRDGALQPAELPALDNALQGYLAALRPGRTAAQVAGEVAALLEREGLSAVADYGLGEGLGLEPVEAPRIAPDDETPLAGGICLAVRLTVHDAELGAAIAGQTVCLTADGARPLLG